MCGCVGVLDGAGSRVFASTSRAQAVVQTDMYLTAFSD